MKERLCNQVGCNGSMRPTRKMSDLNRSHRIYKCVVCGKENPWLDKPVLNGTIGELHCIKTDEYSGLSMINDPQFYPPKPTRRRR